MNLPAKPYQLWWMPFPNEPNHIANRFIESFVSMEKAKDTLSQRAREFRNCETNYVIKEVFTKNDLGDIFP